MRPLAVLLVVLVAIGALISALFFMGSGSSGNVTVEPDLAGSTPPVSGSRGELGDPVRLESGDPGRGSEVDPVGSGGRETVRHVGSATHFDNSLVGSIINRAGAPVAGAQVTLDFQSSELLFESLREDREPGRETVSDAKGEFRFENIEPSDYYTLYVSHSDYCPEKSAGVKVDLEGKSTEPPIVMREGSALSGYVRDTSGSPVTGAQLVLDVNMFSYTPGPQRQTVRSDANGFYSFNHVASGMQTLIVSADGYGTQAHSGMTFNGRDPIVKDVELEVAAIIAGRVTDAVSGRPIEGANVLAMNYSNSNRASRDFLKTDKDGRFSLDHLSAGDYTLMVNAYGYNPDRIQRLQTGELNVSVKLHGKARVHGTVLAADTGQAVRAGALQLRTVHKGTELTSLMDVTGTFEDGKFVLANVPGGEYVIEASALELGYAPTYSPPFVVVEGQDLTGVTIRLKRGASIRGHITDENGSPVAGALVSTHDNNYTASDDEFFKLFGDALANNVTSQSVRTDSDGAFEIKALRPDLYQVNVNATGFVRYIQRNIRLSDDEQLDLQDLQLARGGVVRGTLYDAGGVPLPGGQVILRLEDMDEFPESYQAKSDANGMYRIDSIRPGSYMISATSSTLGGDNPFLDIANRKATQSKITVNEGRTLNYDLHLTGQPSTGTPVSNDPRRR